MFVATLTTMEHSEILAKSDNEYDVISMIGEYIEEVDASDDDMHNNLNAFYEFESTMQVIAVTPWGKVTRGVITLVEITE